MASAAFATSMVTTNRANVTFFIVFFPVYRTPPAGVHAGETARIVRPASGCAQPAISSAAAGGRRQCVQVPLHLFKRSAHSPGNIRIDAPVRASWRIPMSTCAGTSSLTRVYTTADGRAVIEQAQGSVILVSAEQILDVINELHACYDYCAAWKEPALVQDPDAPPA
jgi:hypothetical protein